MRPQVDISIEPGEPLDNALDYGWFKTILVRQYLLWSTVYTMIKYNVPWNKAKSTIDREYYYKCLNTGDPNLLYRPGLIANGEIGPKQRTKELSSYWDILLYLLVALYVYYKLKNKKK
jgi:hypothetical protein